jgi:hypothetical protein
MRRAPDAPERIEEGEPPGEPAAKADRTQPRPPRITKSHLALLGTVAIGAGMLWAGLRRDNQSGRMTGQTVMGQATITGLPNVRSVRSVAATRAADLRGANQRIEALLDSTRRGDVTGYLSAFGGSLRARLDQQVAERGREAFAAGLRRSARAAKSYAVFSAEADDLSSDGASIVVETIFADRNQRQTYRLKQKGAGWLITGVATVRDQIPRHAVGSRAGFREPEGPPVPAFFDEERGKP